MFLNFQPFGAIILHGISLYTANFIADSFLQSGSQKLKINTMYCMNTEKFIEIECKHCKNTFKKQKSTIKFRKGTYCSKQCFYKHISSPPILSNCKNCQKEIKKLNKDVKRYKNIFCSLSCSASYNHKHKKYGCRRSKLEIWIEQNLKEHYPMLNILYNNIEVINAELDIYIPSLKLAFELNGIFHYEPIYGEEKLNKTQINDKRKFQACLEQQIELCIIDTSMAKKFKPERDKKYLEIIFSIIDNKLNILQMLS